MNELKTVLTHQKYPRRIIENGIEKAMSINKSELRLVREKPNDSIITYVSTFNLKQPELFHAIQQNLPILYEGDLMKEIIQKYTIIKSKRQPNNLKRLLTKAKFTDIHELPKISKCNRPNCGVCEHLITENKFVFQCGKTFNVKTTMSCEVRNLICVIRCGECQEEYIGETGETLRHRLTVHRQQIRDASTRMLYVSGHIANCAKNQSIKFQILPLYKMQNNNMTSRKMKENYFINLFKLKLNRHV